jgi:hypothetical protein
VYYGFHILVYHLPTLPTSTDILTGSSAGSNHVLLLQTEEDNMKHVLYETGDVDAPDSIKDGNGDVALGLCKVCGGGECELATDCPGRPITREEGDSICAGELDFKTMKCEDCGRDVRAKLLTGERELLDGYHGECLICGPTYWPEWRLSAADSVK